MWKIRYLRSYLRLRRLSNNVLLIKELIENGIVSYYNIVKIPTFEFQQRFQDKASEEELKAIYYKAKQEVAKNTTLETLTDRIPTDDM